MILRKSLVVARLFILSQIFVGCTLSSQKISTKPVAQVNEHVLSVKEFANQLARKLKNYDALAAKDLSNINRTKEGIIRNFVVKSLTLDWARLNKVFISENTLDKEVDKLRANYPDDLSFRRSLAQENLSFSEWREDLRFVLIEREVFRRIDEKANPVTDEEIKRYYDEHKNDFKRKERVLLRQVLVDDEVKADFIKTQLKTKDFAETAKKYSQAPEAKNGGSIGWVEKGTVDFFDPLFSVGTNNVQQIKSPFGIHLIRAEKKLSASNLPLEEVKNQIKTTLRGQREQAEYVAWLDAQLRGSKVLKDYDLMNSLSVETRGENE